VSAAPSGRAGPPPEGLAPYDDPSVVLDAAADPGAAALGASGAEATVDLPWPVLLRRRVQRRAERSPRYQWWVLFALLAGLLALNITFTVFVVALPTVAGQLHTNISVLTWSSTGPLLAFGLAAPVFGKAGDLFGHRRLYLLGLAGAMVSAVVTATAPNAAVLLFGRALDGVQGAATGTASMALILRMFSKEDRVKALGWWSLVGAGGPVIGMAVGSPVIQFLGWRALFWGQLVLLVLSTVVVVLILPAHGRHSLEETPAEEEPQPTGWKGFDWVGSWSLSGAVVALMLGLSIAPHTGWSSGAVVVPLVLSVASAAVFVHRLRTAAHPLIPPHYFRRRNFVLPMGVRTCSNFAYFGAFFLFPLLMEEVYGYRVTQVGIISIARPLLFAVSAPVAGYLTVRVGERVSALAGSSAVVLSMALFAVLSPGSPLVVIVLALCLAGAGMGVALPPTSSSMANEVTASEYGVMSAAQLLATQVGEVAGIQVLQTIQLSSAHRRVAGGAAHGAALLGSFRTAFVVGGLVGAVGVVCAAGIRDTVRTGRTQPSG